MGEGFSLRGRNGMNDVTVEELEVRPILQGKGHDTWEVDVYVYLHSEDGHHTIESYLQSDSRSENLQFYNNHHPGFNVKFHLIDETGRGYRFPTSNNRKDGIWSKLGYDCPDSPCWDVFDRESIHVYGDGDELIAFNPNIAPAIGDFQYRLNVSLDGSEPWVAIDPGGTNHNGMTSRDDL
jgi:hypothetical protein